MITFPPENKAKILAALYNRGLPQGLGFLHYDSAKVMSEEEAAELLTKTRADNTFDEFAYDRDNGEGAAAQAIGPLGKTKPLVYLASQWDNEVHREIAKAITENGFDLCNRHPTLDGDDYYPLKEQREHRDREYTFDLKQLQRCRAFVLVLPATQESLTSAVWCAARGKPVAIVIPEKEEGLPAMIRAMIDAPYSARFNEHWARPGCSKLRTNPGR